MRYFVLGLCLSYTLIIFVGAYYEPFFDKRVLEPIKAVQFLANLVSDPELSERWYRIEITGKKGVALHKDEKSWGDYTLFTSVDKNEAFIVDMSGSVVYKWDITFPSDRLAYRDHVTAGRLFSDPHDRGNIYIMYFGEKRAVNTYGTIKFDRNSNMLWENLDALHHDMAFLEDGQYMTFLQTAEYTPNSSLPQIEPPFLNDFLAVVDSNNGEILSKVSIIDAFAKSDYRAVLESLNRSPADPNMRDGDLFHPNTITLVPERVSSEFPRIHKNSVMLSFRNIDLIAFLDLDTETISWAFYGPWRGQHDMKFLKNGHIIMLDNQGNTGPGGRSRILEVDMKDLSIVWEYTGTEEKPFFTDYNGMIEILPNDNILVTETHSGRIFEVTRDKDIVWEYYVEGRIEHDGEVRIPSVLSAQRFNKEELSTLLAD